MVLGSGEQVPSAVGPDLLHPALLRARVKVALTDARHGVDTREDFDYNGNDVE